MAATAADLPNVEVRHLTITPDTGLLRQLADCLLDTMVVAVEDVDAIGRWLVRDPGLRVIVIEADLSLLMLTGQRHPVFITQDWRAALNAD